MDVLWRKIILKKNTERKQKKKRRRIPKDCEASYTQIGSEVNLHKNYSFRQNGYKVIYMLFKRKIDGHFNGKETKIYKDLFWGQTKIRPFYRENPMVAFELMSERI